MKVVRYHRQTARHLTFVTAIVGEVSRSKFPAVFIDTTVRFVKLDARELKYMTEITVKGGPKRAARKMLKAAGTRNQPGLGISKPAKRFLKDEVLQNG